MDQLRRPQGLSLELVVPGETGAGWRVGAFRTHIVDAIPVAQEEIASVPIDAEVVTLILPDPDESQFGPFFVGEAASYVVAIYDDRNGDGVRDGDEPVEATRGVLVYYLEDDLDTGDEIVPGETWLALELVFGKNPDSFDLDDPIDLVALPYVTEMTLGGTIAPELLAGVTGISSIQVSGGSGGDPGTFENPPVNQALAVENWEVTLDSPLHEDRRLDGESPLPFEIFGERLVAYESDVGDLTEMSQVRAFACSEDRRSLLLFIPEELDPAEAVFAHLIGYPRGWVAVATEDDALPEPLSSSAHDELVLSPARECDQG